MLVGFRLPVVDHALRGTRDNRGFVMYNKKHENNPLRRNVLKSITGAPGKLIHYNFVRTFGYK